MSWWGSWEDDAGQPVDVPRHEEGGTYALGGVPAAELNITYNYGEHFRFPDLNGLTGKQRSPLRERAGQNLGTVQDADYWKPTPGNAGHACKTLLEWAQMHPHARWRVS